MPRRVTVDYTDKQVGSFIVYEAPAAKLHQATLKIEQTHVWATLNVIPPYQYTMHPSTHPMNYTAGGSRAAVGVHTPRGLLEAGQGPGPPSAASAPIPYRRIIHAANPSI